MSSKDNSEETVPKFSIIGWLSGALGIYLAILFMMVWYFIFAIPFLILFILILVPTGWIMGDFDAAFRLVAVLISPLSIIFLIWIGIGFIFGSYFEIVFKRGLGILAHRLPPKQALAMVEKRRVRTVGQYMAIFNWFRIGRREV